MLLAPIFQQSDARVYYRADGDFSSPKALLNGRIGRLPPSNILDLELRTALYAEAIDPNELRSLSSEPGQALSDLAGHRVDAAVGSVWELPWQARERGVRRPRLMKTRKAVRISSAWRLIACVGRTAEAMAKPSE